jgi:hypothetical protein
MKRLEEQRAEEERHAQKKLANRSEKTSGEHVNVSTYLSLSRRGMVVMRHVKWQFEIEKY